MKCNSSISNKKLIKELEKSAMEIRINLLKLCNQEVIHIGGDLSITDVMTVLWKYKINYNSKLPMDESRDRFVLSKGHASALLSFCQASIGCFSVEEIFKEYAKDKGIFPMHACNLLNPFVEVSTGSLGHGMPIACGIAAGLKLKNNFSSRVYTLMGDGEQSEGSVWEAALNASHYKLGNLIVIIDNNGFEADGSIEEITSLNNLAEKYRVFGWRVDEINGNDITEIVDFFDNLPPVNGEQPICLVAKTIKGKGISFMENNVCWHSGKINDKQLIAGITELKEAYRKRWVL